MEYMYLLLCILLFIPWGIIYYFNSELRRKMLLSGLIAIPFGVVNIWYRIDYWDPPEILFLYIISLEDMLFGFTITGISIAIYDALFTKELIIAGKKRTKTLLFLFPLFIMSFFLLNNVLGINSMFMWSIPMFVFAIIIIIIRNDLLIPSIVTGTLVTIIIIPIYILLFNYVAPDYWDTYWYLTDTKYDIKIFGNVLIVELMQYFSYGCFTGIVYDFTKGKRKIAKKF